MSDFWPEKMTRAGVTATREQMHEAWKNWRGGYYSDLIRELFSQGVGTENKIWSCSRVADGMLQKARKAGLARYQNGKWVKHG